MYWDYEIEVFVFECKFKVIDYECWCRKNIVIGGFFEDEFEVASYSSEGERKFVASDDFVYVVIGEKVVCDSVEVCVV